MNQLKCIICQENLSGIKRKFCSLRCKNKQGNLNHQSYVKQKERGLTRKIELVKILGNECYICGYRKNLAALQFHHRNPLEKDNQMDMRKLSNSTWEWCLNEVKKCDLLCANCHMEYHHPSLDLSKSKENGGPSVHSSTEPLFYEKSALTKG